MTEEWERYRRGQAAKWLEHVYRMGLRVETMQREIDAEREAACGLKAIQYDGMPKAPTSTGDALPSAVIRIQERIAAFVEEMARYTDERGRAHDALSGMSDPLEHRALTYHYLLGYSWEECCVRMHYTYDGMMKLRARALCSAYDLMPLEWRDPMERAI